MGVALRELVIKKEVEIKSLKGRVLIIDSPMWLYQFLSSIRSADGSLFTDSKGNVTSHLIGLSARIPNLMQQGIKLAFCFDGMVPELKYKERQRRKERKIDAEIRFKQAAKEENIEEMKKYAARTTRLTSDMIEEAKKLIRAFGLPVIMASSESEAQAAHIVKQGKAYAVASNDYDSLLFGAGTIIRNLSIVGKRKRASKLSYETVKPELISLAENLNNLGIDQEQLIAMAMLVGTDYNIGGIPKIGPKTALKLVKEYKNDFDALFKKASWDNFFDYPWTEVFYLIKKMPVTNDYELSWKNPDKNKIFNILVGEHNFSEERVNSIFDKLEKEAKKGAQKSLGGWA